mgnify:CR=1 FL=1
MWLILPVIIFLLLLFLLTHPVWDVTIYQPIRLTYSKFLLTHPVWDVTWIAINLFESDNNFYSHIPCGMWLTKLETRVTTLEFLLTHPVWDVTRFLNRLVRCGYISTHTSRVGCDPNQKLQKYKLLFLLTHPVWDVTHLLNHRWLCQNFYSHIPCGMWHISNLYFIICITFLLTHPVWDVTYFSFTSCA